MEVNSWAISFAITFGIAPLLFIQVLFGRFFYTATVLVAWAWLGMLGKGDFINFIGIAFLAGVTVLCYSAIFPIFVRKKDVVYAVLALLEVLVLLLAASGILKAGGH